MEIEVLGIGDAFTSRHYNTCFLIRSTELYLVDCSQGLLRILRERQVNPADVRGVLVTHIHGDHTSGLETLILWKKFVQKSRLVLYTSRQVYSELRDRFFPRFAANFSNDLLEIRNMHFDDYVDYCELVEAGPTRINQQLQVEIRHNWHPAATLGFKLRGRQRTISISGDTCYRPVLLETLFERKTIDAARHQKLAGEWLWSADLVYHEATRHEPTPHTLESDLLRLPEQTRKKLRLVHIPDDFEERDLRVAREGERESF